MKKYDNVKIERAYDGFEPVPVGAYIGEIINAKEEDGRLVIAFDIAEGEYKGYYNNAYKSDTREDKRWKGVFNVWLPKEDGSQQDEWTRRRLGNTLYAIEDSNKGYHWSWDEKTLKGKKIGLNFRMEQYIGNDGQVHETTKCGAFVSVDDVRNGKVKEMKPKLVKDTPATAVSNEYSANELADENLPF